MSAGPDSVSANPTDFLKATKKACVDLLRKAVKDMDNEQGTMSLDVERYLKGNLPPVRQLSDRHSIVDFLDNGYTFDGQFFCDALNNLRSDYVPNLMVFECSCTNLGHSKHEMQLLRVAEIERRTVDAQKERDEYFRAAIKFMRCCKAKDNALVDALDDAALLYGEVQRLLAENKHLAALVNRRKSDNLTTPSIGTFITPSSLKPNGYSIDTKKLNRKKRVHDNTSDAESEEVTDLAPSRKKRKHTNASPASSTVVGGERSRGRKTFNSILAGLGTRDEWEKSDHESENQQNSDGETVEKGDEDGEHASDRDYEESRSVPIKISEARRAKGFKNLPSNKQSSARPASNSADKSASSHVKTSAWTESDMAALTEVVKTQLLGQRNGSLPLLLDVKLWSHGSSELERCYNIERTPNAYKNIWSRKGRAGSGSEERGASRRSNSLSTSVQ